jgi:hypothetical protein
MVKYTCSQQMRDESACRRKESKRLQYSEGDAYTENKLTLPATLLIKDIKNQDFAHIPNDLCGMTDGERIALAACFALTVLPFRERGTVWTV